MSSEKFCLRWNDFESNISVAFREIREEKDFFDVTLSVGDRQLQAHKLILSACSPFFRSVLRKNPHQNPLLYLKGVEFSDLQAVLNFMYHGEVNVAQEDLNSFLAVAEDLKVKGLTQNNSDSAPKPPSRAPEPSRPTSAPRVSAPPSEVSAPPAPKRPRPAPAPAAAFQQDDDDIQEVMPVVKQEPVASVVSEPPQVQQTVAPTTSSYQQSSSQAHVDTYQQGGSGGTVAHMDDQLQAYEDDGYDYGGYEGDEAYEGMEGGAVTDNSKGQDDESNYQFEAANAMIDDSGPVPACTRCGKTASKRSDLVKHVISKHIPTPAVSCQFCSKQYKNRNSLQVHISQNHRDDYSSMKNLY